MMDSKYTPENVDLLLGDIPYIEDAPMDGKIYARSRDSWVDITGNAELQPQIAMDVSNVFNADFSKKYIINILGVGLSDPMVLSSGIIGDNQPINGAVVITYLSGWSALTGGQIEVSFVEDVVGETSFAYVDAKSDTLYAVAKFN